MKLPEPPFLRELDRSNEQEVNLITAGWLRTYVASSVGVERSVFFRLCEPVVKQLIATSSVVVACMPSDHDIIYSWVCFAGDVLHYCVTKPRWQRLGIASFLLRDHMKIPVTYTHKTSDGMRLPIPQAWGYEPMRRFP